MSHSGYLHSKLLLLGLMLPLAALVIGCTGMPEEGPAGSRTGETIVRATVVLPTPTLRPTLTPTPTPTRFILVSIEEVLAPLEIALQSYQNPEEDREALIRAFRRTVGSFLVSAPHPLTNTTVETLTTGIQALMQPSTEGELVTVVADLDQDREPDLVLGLPWLVGMPAFAFLSSQHYTGVTLPAPEPADQADDLLLYAWPSAARAEDVTGEGQPELLVNYMAPGGSGVTDRLYIFRWQPEQRTLVPVFQATLISWAAESSWYLQPGPQNSQEIVLQGPAFGPFDHKLLPHPIETQVWQWDGAMDRFGLAEKTISAPETPRQQFNLAESLFRQGDYEQALLEFQRVLTLNIAPELAAMEDSSTDWIALAQLRLGQTHALLGQPDAARTELAQAQAAGSVIGDLATAFLEAYQEDTIPAAWAAMMVEVDLYEFFYNESEGNLSFPVDPSGLYYAGLAMAAYLDRHPEATDEPVQQLAANLADQDYYLKSLLIEDISGDGQPEVAFVRPEPAQSTDRLWLAYREEGRWRVTLLTEWDNVRLEGATPLPAGETMLLVTFPSANTRPPSGYGWGPEGVITYDLAGEAPQVVPREFWPTLGGL